MMRDPYLYLNTEVLKNKLGVMDNEKLNTIEAEYTSTRLKELMENPIKGNFDLDHLCRMHYYIFQDLYDWAGQPRIINIEKSEPVRTLTLQAKTHFSGAKIRKIKTAKSSPRG